MASDVDQLRPQGAAGLATHSRGKLRLNFVAYAFLLPSFLFYAGFRLIPYFQAFWFGLYDWNGASPGKFIGAGNYIEVVQDKYFWNAAGHNVIWMAMNLTIPLGLALILALLVAEVKRGQSVFRVCLFFPHVLSAATVAVLWRQIYDPSIGILNTIMNAIGLGSLTHSWLGETATALPASNIANAWQSYGFSFVMFLAALQSIDPTQFEAAKLDGANWFQTVRYVTLPGLRNATTMLFSLAIMGSMLSFTMIWVLTGGGPNFASDVLSTYIYDKAFMGLRVGYACAVSVGLALWILFVTVTFIRIRERGDN